MSSSTLCHQTKRLFVLMNKSLATIITLGVTLIQPSTLGTNEQSMGTIATDSGPRHEPIL
jgi:hypothetical protein